ncbi:UNVERIFIED_CONTAM: hypothetical protein K2H54_014894 [Gekko kuhli]
MSLSWREKLKNPEALPCHDSPAFFGYLEKQVSTVTSPTAASHREAERHRCTSEHQRKLAWDGKGTLRTSVTTTMARRNTALRQTPGILFAHSVCPPCLYRELWGCWGLRSRFLEPGQPVTKG